jgi:hypothetical protein
MSSRKTTGMRDIDALLRAGWTCLSRLSYLHSRRGSGVRSRPGSTGVIAVVAVAALVVALAVVAAVEPVGGVFIFFFFILLRLLVLGLVPSHLCLHLHLRRAP